MRLTEVRVNLDCGMLYELLKERDPEQSISHKEMPTFDEHKAFVASRPYEAWYLIWVDSWSRMEPSKAIGAIYLTKQREIGIGIFKEHKSKGYGTEAVKMLMELHPGRFLANIAPDNYSSRMFFTEQFGAKLIQNTYQLESA